MNVRNGLGEISRVVAATCPKHSNGIGIREKSPAGTGAGGRGAKREGLGGPQGSSERPEGRMAVTGTGRGREGSGATGHSAGRPER